MNLVRYNPHRRVSGQCNTGSRFFDELFDDFFSPLTLVNSRKQGDTPSLKVDIYEKDDLIVIDAELPGVDKDDITVDVKGRLVTLGAESKFDEEVKDDKNYRRERRFGKVERTFNLPFEITSDDVKASYNNGLLKLEISKPEEQVVKKIPIN